MFWRAMSVLAIAFTLVIQVFALTALFDAWELFDTAWRPELYQLGKYYMYATLIVSENVGGLGTTLFGDLPVMKNLVLPCWWVHVLAMYAAAAGAIYAGSMSRDERDRRIGQVKRGGMSIFWPLAIGSLIIDGARNRVVSSFLKHHSNTALFYGVAALGLYAAANWANAEMLDGPPVPGQEIRLKNETPCPVTNSDAARDQLADLIVS